jgi:hypothetical protein
MSYTTFSCCFVLHFDYVMCIVLILVILFHSLDPTHEEPELEAQVDQAEEANPELEPEQDKPQCI